MNADLLALLGIILGFAGFIFTMIKWLLSKIEKTSDRVKKDLLDTQQRNHVLLWELSKAFQEHQISDTHVFGEIRTSLSEIKNIRRKR